jgi:hypothetical protein
MVELDVDQPVRTEAVDPQNADQVAVMRGPQVLFAISDAQPRLRRDQLARLQLAKAANSDWTLQVERSKVLLRPFASIGDEIYQTYWRVVS